MEELDQDFFKRADEHIKLANEQLSKVSVGKVNASMLYSVARFNSWISANGWENKQEMQDAKDKTVEYFVDQYKKMLEDNLEDYIQNFDKYIKKNS